MKTKKSWETWISQSRIIKRYQKQILQFIKDYETDMEEISLNFYNSVGVKIISNSRYLANEIRRDFWYFQSLKDDYDVIIFLVDTKRDIQKINDLRPPKKSVLIRRTNFIDEYVKGSLNFSSINIPFEKTLGVSISDADTNLRIDLIKNPGLCYYMILRSRIRALIAELLERFGYYMIHGAALDMDGYGITFLSPPRFGKTTLSLILLQEGLLLLSDDCPLLHLDESGLQLLAFPIRPILSREFLGEKPIELDHKKVVRSTMLRTTIIPFIWYCKHSEFKKTDSDSVLDILYATIVYQFTFGRRELPTEIIQKRVNLLKWIKDNTEIYSLFMGSDREQLKNRLRYLLTVLRGRSY